MLPTINTVILKVAAPCNLDCSYCYEYNRGDDTWRRKPGTISLDLIHALGRRIREHGERHGLHTFSVNAHGGEPMLLGADGLDRLFTALRDSAGPAVRLRLGMQTNATLTTAAIVDVLERHRVSVGVSLDGDRTANRFRMDHRGRPAFDRILEGLATLRRGHVHFTGFLAVIDPGSDPAEVLDFLAGFDPPQIDLLPPFGNHDNPPEVAAAGGLLGDWLLRAFRHWTDRPGLRDIRIRFLEDALAAIVGDESRSDWFGLRPPGYVVVSSDGAYEGLDTLKVAGAGRILNATVEEQSIDEILAHEEMRRRRTGLAQLAPVCQGCPIVRWCGGGYLPTRFGKGNDFANPSIYCPDLRALFRGLGKWLQGQPAVGEDGRRRISETLQALDKHRFDAGALPRCVPLP